MTSRLDNILCVANWRSDVGYAWWLMERFWEAIARHYPGRVVICFPRLGGVSERLQSSGAKLVEFDFDDGDVRAFARAHGIAHYYLTDKAYYSPRYMWLRASGAKSIIVHDHTPGERIVPTGAKALLKKVRFAFPAFAADAYIAVSNLVHQRHRTIVGAPASRCHIAQNGVDLDVTFQPHDIRGELGLPPDALVCVSSSRATQYKRVHHIIEAAAKVPGVYFVHCGDGPDLPFFRSEVERHGLEGRFFLVCRRADVPHILAAADMAVHASTGEVGTSLSILEFQRAGLPIVLPACPTVCQSVEDERSALLYQPGNIDELAEKLRRVAADEGLRNRLGAGAAAQVRHFNIEHTVKAVLDVFRRLAI